MRALAMAVGIVLAVPGCILYVGDDGPIEDDDGGSCRSVDCSDDAGPPPPPPDDVYCPGVARCEAGIVTLTGEGYFPGYCPEGGEVVEVGLCERGCLQSELHCYDDVCTPPSGLLETMCYAPAPVLACTDVGGACDEEGAARACEPAVVCDVAYGTGACACFDGTWSCDVPCTDGLCSAAAVQDALVGRWAGSASAVFGYTWNLDLEILPDRHYVGDAHSDDPVIAGAFYYGADGMLELQWIDIVSQSDTGATGRVTVAWGANVAVAEIFNLRLVGDTLTFTFSPTWFGCGYEIDYTLTRVGP